MLDNTLQWIYTDIVSGREKPQRSDMMEKTIKEIKMNMGNNESIIRAGVYQEADGTYRWLTATRCGSCKRLETAMKKAGF